jgi:hypothetical protein
VGGKLNELRANLTPNQDIAAELLAANPFKPRKVNSEKGVTEEDVQLTMEQIAEHADITARHLYRWRHEDEDFIAYVNELSTRAFMSQLPKVQSKHLDMALNGQGSMKGIELFYKVGGLLVDKHEVKSDEPSKRQSLDERLETLKQRAKGIENNGDD